MKDDAQKDESTAGTDMTCQILLIKFLDVSAVLRACCASVDSFLVWAVARQVLEQKVGGSIPASDEVKKPEGFPGTYGRPPRRKIEIVMGTLQ
ncbi:hypothetical protein PAPYR_11285 [Paratrimastix pyriformis]|uniref:Uncharacterized protein n=1 Tax=Paratrimastix pyriformis TaxID=342808 RepID=A0ABQ8U409_9EUKA|nr:hypothetical protein PAPYR_11285 [Paratrimastix pyriformis]